MKIPKEAMNYIQEKMDEYWRQGNHSWPEESTTWAIMLFLEWQGKNPCWDCNSSDKRVVCPGIKEGCKIREYRQRHT